MNAVSSVDVRVENKTVTAYLSGEIDHHNAPLLRSKIDSAIIKCRPKMLILDFSSVSFMDSSGIGLVMGRYSLISGSDCKMYVLNLSGHAYKVMRLAGLEKIATLKRSSKEESAK